MQIEITLSAAPGAGYDARDLGFLLHKNPANVFRRETSAGVATVFFAEAGAERASAVLHLDVDPVGLVRGKGQGDGLLESYVNDRPYVANSFLSVALSRSFGQSMAGISRERQALADTALPFEARVVPVALAGGIEVVEALFAPLGYAAQAAVIEGTGGRPLIDLRLSGAVRLADLLAHLYVLVPVLDNAKHYWIDREEIEKLLDKGEGWLGAHPAQELIVKRALKHRRALVEGALARLAEEMTDEADEAEPVEAPEAALEKPIRLHDLRLDTVAQVLRDAGAARVLDLGCGEGRLIGRLVKDAAFREIVGIDASARTLARAAKRLHLGDGGARAERVRLSMGSLTYADRRWSGFDAAALVEVIEHVELARLSALELSVFADARPRTVVVTTPNREYNALFEGLAEGRLRHPDHRFEWTRAEFADWVSRVAGAHGYTAAIHPVGPEDEAHGAPSQMAVFTLAAEEAAA